MFQPYDWARLLPLSTYVIVCPFQLVLKICLLLPPKDSGCTFSWCGCWWFGFGWYSQVGRDVVEGLWFGCGECWCRWLNGCRVCPFPFGWWRWHPASYQRWDVGNARISTDVLASFYSSLQCFHAGQVSFAGSCCFFAAPCPEFS